MVMRCELLIDNSKIAKLPKVDVLVDYLGGRYYIGYWILYKSLKVYFL